MRRVTLPNMLTSMRLVFVVLLFPLAFTNRVWFIVVFVLTMLTDVLDGMAARFFLQESEFGQRFDGITDGILYVCLFFWFMILEPVATRQHIVYFGIIAGVHFLNIMLKRRALGKYYSYHLYSAKFNAVVTFVFSFITFYSGMVYGLLVVVTFTNVLTALEEFVLYTWYPAARVQAVWEVLK